MKSTVAVVLVVISLAAAEPPRFRASARQTAPDAFQPPAASAPYNPSGWRPQGAPFTLPKPQPQQAYGPPAPVASYGPPPLQPTTTEYTISDADSTELPQFGRVTSKTDSAKTSAGVQKQSPGSYYVVVPQSTVVLQQPQSQNLVYAVTEVQKSAPLVTVPQATILAAPLTSAQFQALPVSTFNAVYSPSAPLTAPYVVYS